MESGRSAYGAHYTLRRVDTRCEHVEVDSQILFQLKVACLSHFENLLSDPQYGRPSNRTDGQ
jgi:hypothetical protein